MSNRNLARMGTNLAISVLLPLVLAGGVTGCGGKSDDPQTSTLGGASGSPVGGSGGAIASASTGGSSQNTSTTAFGGKTGATGGSNNGGEATVQSATGGMTMGGSSSTGGASPNGGAPAVGGASTKGGSSSTGGATTKGGSSSTGGATTKGGSSSTGGATTKGGSSSAGGTTASAGSSSIGGTSGGSSANNIPAFTTSYIAPYCSRLASCCTAAGFAAPDATACKDHELLFYGDTLGDGSAQVNSAGVAALLTALQNSCDQPSYALYGELTVGTRPLGSDCSDVSQCQGTSVMCQILTTASVGKCVALTRGEGGDACVVTCNDTSSCRWTVMGAGPGVAACWDQDSLRCDETEHCVALSGIGKACDSGTCGEHADCYNGLCRAKGKLGQDCSDGRSCESTLLCDSTTYKCIKMSIAWSGSCEAA